MYMGSTWEKCLRAGIYTWDFSIPANLLSIPSILLSSNCIVFKRLAHAH